ncbi:MAG: hypothetical protein CMJ18_21585, partial [Phycisphaeraceae bacterium]|nr:hypothetical protein [Phycisphaeraceae bacterium]
MVSLVIDGRPACVVETGDRATATEVHAAEELASYLKRMSGAKVPIGGPGGGDRVVIGTPATSSRVRALVERGLVTLSADVPGHDGFIVRTLKDGDHNVLVIASMVPRGCLHGVYHLLETQLRVGFFWDGEQVPRRDTIRLTDLNLVERPDFGEREYLQACAYGYTAMFWTIDEWKRELDWAARKKFNLVQINWGNAVPLFHALKSMGVEGLTPPTPWEEHETQLAVAIHRHCRKLGLRVIGPAFDGRVPPEVRKAFPGARYVAVQWLDLPPKFPIAPSDPLFVRIGAQFIREHIKLCGTDHFYNTDPYPETDPGATEQEKRSVKVDFAKALVASIRAADPEGTWIISGWGMGWGNTWDEQDVEAFLQVIPDDMFVVNDIWAERNPIYERFSYFHGKRWGFSVLHSMGGWTTPHGDLADLIRRMQAVRADPKADHCTNFYLNPEILNQNDVYIDLAANLSWRSTDVTVDAFLDDYLVRRYGPDAGMRKCWDALLESVYAHYDYTAPAYQTRPTLKVPESYGKLRHAYIPHLADALRAALAQASQLADNNFFQRDVVDMARQYVAEVFNLHFARLVAAFEA